MQIEAPEEAKGEEAKQNLPPSSMNLQENISQEFLEALPEDIR